MLEAGFAEKEITPAVGAIIPGGFSARISTGILDPLQVTACVIRNAELTFAIIGVDAVSLSCATAETIRAEVARPLGILPENVIVAASHAHGGGPTNDVLGSDSDAGYLATVTARVKEAAVEAHTRLQPARCCDARGQCPEWAFNRRFKMRDGSEATQPQRGSPDIVEPAGPADPELGIVAFQSLNGEPLGAIACFACHPTVVWGTLFSGDYPSFWRTALRQKVDPAFTLVFLNGACGNIGPVDYAKPAGGEKSLDRVRAMGDALADETIRLMKTIPFTDAAELSIVHSGVEVEYRHPAAEALAGARALVESETPWDSKKWQARDLILLAKELGNKQSVTCPIDVVRIGNAVVACAPWQPFCEFGLRIKAGATHRTVLPASFANGSLGYVPTPQAFLGGGYEPTLCRGSKLTPPAGDVITAEFLRVLSQV